MFALIDMQFQQAFLENKNELFDDKSIIIFDDFGQLPPVLDLSIYVDAKQDLLFNSGMAAYKQFKEVYKLEIAQCQSGNSKEQ